MNYILTPDAQTLARALVKAWDNSEIEQLCTYSELRGAGRVAASLLICSETGQQYGGHVKRGYLNEMADANLIRMQQIGSDSWEITLLTRLRDAVRNNFLVKEYTVPNFSVGTVVHGDLMLGGGASFQSAASVEGNITQSIERVADTLQSTLGEEILSTNEALNTAILELQKSVADKPLTRQQKLGNVILELGRCLEHTANATAVIAAIIKVAPLLQSMS